MPGMPRTPLIIFQKKMSLEMASKEGCDLQDILWAHCHLSHPIVLSCPQPEVPGFNAHIGASTSQQPGPWPWPQVHGHRRDCSKEVTAHGSWDRPATDGAAQHIPYPVAHVSVKLKRQHIN